MYLRAFDSNEISIHYAESSSSTNIPTIYFSVRLPWTLNSFLKYFQTHVSMLVFPFRISLTQARWDTYRTCRLKSNPQITHCRLNGPNRPKKQHFIDFIFGFINTVAALSIFYAMQSQIIEHPCDTI